MPRKSQAQRATKTHENRNDTSAPMRRGDTRGTTSMKAQDVYSITPTAYMQSELVFTGRQIAAGRGLAGLGIKDFADHVGMTVPALKAVEATDLIEFQAYRIDGRIRRFPGPVVDRIVRALNELGVRFQAVEEEEVKVALVLP